MIICKQIKKLFIMKKKKIAFLDRDGALIFEPPVTEQVDGIEQLEILPGVIEGLKNLIKNDYLLVMVTNQDGLGTTSNPLENFGIVQKELFRLFTEQGIEFHKIFACPHFPADNCPCRKPKLGMVEEFLKETPIDLNSSLMIGDRPSDKEFASNLGILFFPMETNGKFPDTHQVIKAIKLFNE